MYLKEYERLVRTMSRQRLDPLYIRHYLIETYQLTDTIVDQVFASAGITVQAKQTLVQKTKDMMSGGRKPATGGGDGKVKRSEFY